jgi:hypothetical protein
VNTLDPSKKYFMKNFNTLLIIIVLGCILSGCKKMEVGLPASINIPESLSRDSNFKVLVQLEIALKDKIIAEQINASSMNDPRLVKYLTQFNAEYYKAWNKLKNRYDNMNEQDIKDASKTYFQQEKLFALNENTVQSNSIQSNAMNHCTWGYDLCIAGVTAGAIICHSSCIGGTAGFGAPVCLLLCGTIQVAAGAQCMNSYCDFNK